MVKIRLHGTWNEVKESKEKIEKVFRVLSASEPIRDRGKTEYWRVYMECEETPQNINYE